MMKSIEELAREAGINTECMNMGGASHVTTEGCNGVAQAEFERFAALVRAQAMEEVAAICAKAEADLRGVGGWDNGMVGVPAVGVKSLVERLRAAMAST